MNQNFDSLTTDGKKQLLEFSEFLLIKSSKELSEGVADIPQDPLEIPRPEKESVIKAIKRLSRTYPMVDKSNMLTKTSSLMTEHVIKGKAAHDVIDELEEAFQAEHNNISKR